MHFLFLVEMLLVSASAVPQLPEYAALEAEYGEIPFKIETKNYYPSEFQRINGDPHGQAAEREKPDDLGDETLSFDFPNDDDNSYYVLLWSHEATGLIIEGSVSKKRLNAIYINHEKFSIAFGEYFIAYQSDQLTHVHNQGYADSFDDSLYNIMSARISSTRVLNNVLFEYLDYQFIIIGPDGVYEPVYNVTGNIEQALSITKVRGYIRNLDGLMGQIHGYWIYSAQNPGLGDHALAQQTSLVI